MAKGKNAAALFEVINKDRRPGAKAALRTPAWWSKNKVNQPAPAAAPSASKAPAVPTSNNAASATRFHLTSTSMMLAGTGVVIGFLLALFFTTRGGDRPKLSEHTTLELRAMPANPQVMEVKRGEAGLTPLPPKNGNPGSTSDVQQHLPPPVEIPKPTPQVFDGKRTIGLNYVVIQSYPEIKMAEEARDILAKNGIQTTFEKGLRGMNTNYTIVVGTEGFARIHSPEFEGYVKRVEQISDSFAKKKSFKAFTPFGYKWDKTDR